ncbi:HigA family addiction module antitoxin [Mycobacteroides abscessus subsp. abscessus]|uniref:HigA family addiction module antitoxin n=1 Tax=Mycobacteroides abscessus TaxID=36809 RepID=UPI0039F052FA
MTATTDYAVAPGEYLEEWIDEQGLSQQQVADRLGVSRKHVNELVNGRAPVTQDTAIRLERVVGIPASAWLRYEAAYRADLARIADQENLAQHVDKIDPSAVTYLRSMKVTTATRAKPGQLVSDFLAYHRCGTWDAYVHLHESATSGDYALAALKESGADLDQTLLTTWLRAAELTATFERGRTFTYREDDLRAVLPGLRERAARPDEVMLHDIAGMLAEIGVVFLVVPPPKKFPLLGMTRWIDKKVPVIQQTGRWGKDGFVIWTLFHEIGHVLNDPRGEMHLEFKTEKKRNSVAEKKANEFAFETLFGPEGLEPFQGLTSDRDIAAAARRVGVSPGVAVQQMHRRRLLDYRFGNRLFVNIKDTFEV